MSWVSESEVFTSDLKYVLSCFDSTIVLLTHDGGQDLRALAGEPGGVPRGPALRGRRLGTHGATGQ